MHKRTKRMAAIAAGAAIAGLSSVFLHAASAGERGQPSKLYASEATRENLGWIADKLPEWAGMPVIVAGTEDVAALKQAITTAIKTANRKNLDAAAVLQSADPDFTDPIAAKVVLSGRFNKAWASALTWPIAFQGQKRQNVCTIALFPRDYTAQDYASALVFFPVDKKALAGESARDWNAIIMAHESGHCTDMTNGHLASMTTLMGEVSADQQGMDRVFKAYEDAEPVNVKVLDSWKAIRTIGSVTRLCEEGRNGEDHATGMAIHVPSAKEKAPHHDEIITLELVPLYEAIVAKAGSFPAKLADYREKVCHLVQKEPHKLYTVMQELESEQPFPPGSKRQRLVTAWLDAVQKYGRRHFGLDTTTTAQNLTFSRYIP